MSIMRHTSGRSFLLESSTRRAAARRKKDLLLKLVSSSTFADLLSAEISSLSARFIRCKAKPTDDKASSAAKSSATSANVLIDLSKDAANPATSENTTTTAATTKICMASRWANKVSVGAVRSARRITTIPAAVLSTSKPTSSRCGRFGGTVIGAYIIARLLRHNREVVSSHQGVL